MGYIRWSTEASDHIRTRSTRYPGTFDIEPAWTTEVLNDPDRLVDEPDPNSAYSNSVRIVGYSLSAKTVLTVVGLLDAESRLHGATAFKTSGAMLRHYQEVNRNE